MRLKLFGPPGTGKTTRLLAYLADELKEVRPERVAFLTFTRAARAEALRRVELTEAQTPYFRTIHSICYRELGIVQDQIIKVKDLRYFGRQLGVRLTGQGDPFAVDELGNSAEPPTAADILLQLNHLGRHRGVKLVEVLRASVTDIDLHFARFFTLAYRDWKTKEEMVDYTDLLSDYLAMGQPLPVDVIFVDEAQDLSVLQWRVVHKLGERARRWYVAGDDDQAIFGWAGASADLFLDETCSEEVVLEKSYRLPTVVLKTALEVAGRIRHRKAKVYEARATGGEVTPVGQLATDLLGASSTFVLYRNFHRGRELRRQLETLSVPFTGAGGVLTDPKVRAALAAWERATSGQPLDGAQARALAAYTGPAWLRPGLDLKDGQLVRWDQLFLRRPVADDWREVLHRLPGRDYLARCASFHGFRALLAPSVRLASIHQSKGQEADTVILDTELARKTWDGLRRDPDDEHRVWYVAVTRARERLFTLLPTDTLVYHL